MSRDGIFKKALETTAEFAERALLQTVATGIWMACPTSTNSFCHNEEKDVLIKDYDPVLIEMLSSMFAKHAQGLNQLGFGCHLQLDAPKIWILAGTNLQSKEEATGFILVTRDDAGTVSVLQRNRCAESPSSIIVSGQLLSDKQIVISDDPLRVLCDDGNYTQMCSTSGEWRVQDIKQVLKMVPSMTFILDKDRISAKSIANWASCMEQHACVVRPVQYGRTPSCHKPDSRWRPATPYLAQQQHSFMQ